MGPSGINDRAQQQLTQLSKKMGAKNASVFLSVLGRDKQFINAIETPLGQELLKDAVEHSEECVSLYLQEKDKPEDRARLQAYLAIIKKWQTIINRYEKNREKFKNLTS